MAGSTRSSPEVTDRWCGTPLPIGPSSVLAAQDTPQGGMAVGNLDRNSSDLDVTMGTIWFENPRLRPFPGLPVGAAPAEESERGHRDLDRDGKLDIVLRGESDSVVTLFK